ncbi:hypothetical protein RFI_35133 [Reticulomyxa filosa]|uniref:U-box domain-containing protein n=1 Tax=Reticulomyxa filosa TaxID=46433 RepID=X6LMC9_RETFI|nr:hypothetical protein RFI_35133 [Reticulomyxa filosa]|eukprot:ETO02302.1 hypothetical protein RFI_35133 [Reticulomyxa filosa]
MFNYAFQSLTELPNLLSCSQCIMFNDEILVCGGSETNECYSYHTLKKHYKYICSYPNDVKFNGHCVLQWKHSQTEANKIHLLSFGGQGKDKMKQTFSMTYQSVWDNNSYQSDVKSEPGSVVQTPNVWNRHEQDSKIGTIEDNLEGMRGLIGGKNNDLLFITHNPQNIEVIDLKIMKSLTGIRNNIMPIKKHEYGIGYHCFVPLTMNNEKVINHFILFCHSTGLLIKYDEQNKAFDCEELPTCPYLQQFRSYSFVYCNDCIFTFGGLNIATSCRSKNVSMYSMKDKIWSQCNSTLPKETSATFALLDNNNMNVHIIGGRNTQNKIQKTHLRINAFELFEKSQLYKMANANAQEIVRLRKEIEKMKLERPYVIPMERVREYANDRKEQNEVISDSSEEKMQTEMKIFEKQLNEWKQEKRIISHEMGWNDIWSYDGAFQQIKNKDLTRMDNISSFLKTLLIFRNSINVCFCLLLFVIFEHECTTKYGKEITERQNAIKQQIAKKIVEKMQLKEEADAAQNQQHMIQINETNALNGTLLKCCDEFNIKLQQLIEGSQKWKEKQWSELEKKWSVWNSQEIAIFVAHTLKCKKSKVNYFHEIIERKRLDRTSLLKMSKNDWMDIFNLETFSQACLIHDSFTQICNKYPIHVIDSADNNAQQDIPKEFLCPLSNCIMKDPVIALDGVTYDRSSILNRYHTFPNAAILLMMDI